MIGFVGLSHLGLNYSLATAAKGFDVVAYDPDAMLTARCAAGEFPIEEAGFGESSPNIARGSVTSDETALAECELFLSLMCN
jgi:UDPglucose 6-dehydrogenase